MRLMKTVARRVALGLAETKRFAIINEDWSILPTTNYRTWFSYTNVFSSLLVAADSYRMVGQEIQTPLLKCKFEFQIPWDLIYLNEPNNVGSVVLHVMLIASNEQDPTTGPLTYTNSSFEATSDWFYQSDAWRATMNGNNVKVLRKWTRQVNPDQFIGGTTIRGRSTVRGKLQYRWKRRMTFEDTAVTTTGTPTQSKILRGWNYYLLCGWGLQTLLGAAVNNGWPSMRMDRFLYYKDP